MSSCLAAGSAGWLLANALLAARRRKMHWGVGLKKEELLNSDGTLKVPPKSWHKVGSKRQAENNLGFILMGIRDLILYLMGGCYRKKMG